LSRKYGDLLFSLVLLGVVAWMAWEARKWDTRASLFPLVIGVPGIALALLQVGFAVRNLRRAPVTEMAMAEPEAMPAAVEGATTQAANGAVAASSSATVMAEAVERAFGAGSAVEQEESIAPELVRRRTLEMSAWIVGITVGIVVLGFELGAAVVSFAFLRFPGKETIRTSLVVALLTYLFFYTVFDRALNIPFPSGTLSDVMGLTEPLDHYAMDPIVNLLPGH
jgi:hypothetical protein